MDRLDAQPAGRPPPSGQGPAGAGADPATEEPAVRSGRQGSSDTVVEVLRGWCARQPDKVLYTWLDEQGDPVQAWSYRALEQRADAVCHALLHQWSCRQGDRAALMYLPGLDFIAGFWGCLFAGVIAVPVYPVDLRGDAFEKSVERFGRIVADCEAKLVLSHSQYLGKKRLHAVKNMFGSASWPVGLEFEATDQLKPRDDCGTDYQPGLDELAFLQFTSGSTGDPKGVMLSHGNLAENCEQMETNYGLYDDGVSVSWLPQYHDMGLIGMIVGTIYAGSSLVMLAPVSFISLPLLWLLTMSEYNAAHSAAPNFAYGLCLKINMEARRKLDLSHVMMLMNAAEPVSHETVTQFIDGFLIAGIETHMITPGYGLAKATLVVTCSHTGGLHLEPVSNRFLKAQLHDAGRAQLAAADAPKIETVCLVSSGRPFPGSLLCITQQALSGKLENQAEGHVGEICLSSPSKAQGYWGKPELSRDTFQATIKDDPTGTEYLRTGDLGFIHEGELYICGRLKDLIIVRGKNYYPQDIERSAERHPSLRPGCSAAFGVDVGGEEAVVLVAEVRGEPSEPELEQIMAAVHAAIATDHQLHCRAVLLLKERTILKTTSGKIRRKACRQGFLDWQQRRQAAAGVDTVSATGLFGLVADWTTSSGNSNAPALLQVVASRLSNDETGTLSAATTHSDGVPGRQELNKANSPTKGVEAEKAGEEVETAKKALSIVEAFQADLLQWAPTRQVQPDQALAQVNQFKLFTTQLQTLIQLFHRMLDQPAGDLYSLAPASALSCVHGLLELASSFVRRGSNFFGSRRVNTECAYSRHVGSLELVRKLEGPMVSSEVLLSDVHLDWLARELGTISPTKPVDACPATSGAAVAFMKLAELVANDIAMVQFLRNQALLQWTRAQWLAAIGSPESVGPTKSSLHAEYCDAGTELMLQKSPDVMAKLADYCAAPNQARWQECLDQVRLNSDCLTLMHDGCCSLRHFLCITYALTQQDADFAQLVGYQNTLSRIPLMMATEEQKQQFGIDFGNTTLGSYMLTEETSGSAMKNIQAKVHHGELSGTKYWAGFACGRVKYGDQLPVHWYIVSAYDKNKEWQLVLVDGRSEGITVDCQWSTLGLRKTPFAQVTFDHVPVVFAWGNSSYDVALQTMNVTRLVIGVCVLGILARLCSIVEAWGKGKDATTLCACHAFIHHGLGLIDALIAPDASATDPVNMHVCMAIKVLLPDYAIELAEELEITLGTTAPDGHILGSQGRGLESEFTCESFTQLVDTLRISCIFEGPSELWYSELLKLRTMDGLTRHILSQAMLLNQPREAAHYVAFSVLLYFMPEDRMDGAVTAWIMSEIDRLWCLLIKSVTLGNPEHDVCRNGEGLLVSHPLDSLRPPLDVSGIPEASSGVACQVQDCRLIRDAIKQTVLREVQRVTGQVDLAADHSLVSRGLSSMAATEVAASLSESLKHDLGVSAVKLPASLLLEHSTVKEVAVFLASSLPNFLSSEAGSTPGSLQTGQCPAGTLLSGVSLLLKPDSALALYTEGILSPSGMMRPFDEAADGMVWGEASAALVLQPEAAQQDSLSEPITCALTKGSTGLGMTVDSNQLVVNRFKDVPAGQPNPGLTAVPALKLGDRIVAVDGVRVQNKEQLKKLVARSGKTVQITVERDQSRTMASKCRLVGSAVSCNNALMPTGFTDERAVQQIAEAVFSEARIVPQRLAMCHPHAMGNRGSDGPELRGLLQALRPEERQGKLVLAGHKANFGHSVCAAGLISVVVSTLALQHRVVPVHLGVKNLMEILQKAERRVVLPVDKPAKLEETDSEEHRMYGSISGLGMSGHNAHMVLGRWSGRDSYVANLKSHEASQ